MGGDRTWEEVLNGPKKGCYKFDYGGDWEWAIAAYVPALILTVVIGVNGIRIKGFELISLLVATCIMVLGISFVGIYCGVGERSDEKHVAPQPCSPLFEHPLRRRDPRFASAALLCFRACGVLLPCRLRDEITVGVGDETGGVDDMAHVQKVLPCSASHSLTFETLPSHGPGECSQGWNPF